MCGIAGILNLGHGPPIDLVDLRRMADQLVHRGPDDDGFHVDPGGRCGLAFRRLSIIDLGGGRQPIANEDESVWLTFNGEIYNFRDLRRALEATGHRFRTASDSEAIVHAYEQWGDDCLTRLEGMFAIALWDERRGRLLLARDRFGKKPLVYANWRGRFFWASEAKSILALPGMPREIDPVALNDYLTLQYVPAPRSIFRHFGKLGRGERLSLDAERGAAPPQPVAWWSIPSAPARFAGTYDDAREQLGILLPRAVEKRLVADVPLGAFLSGGIDSSIVVGLMRRLGVSPLRTYSIAFSDARYDESAHARQVARHFQTEHHETTVAPDALAVLDRLVHHFDEPMADSSAIPTYYVSQYARSGVTVALTGDGGDEAFAGYDRYRAARLAERIPAPLRALAARGAGWLPRGRSKSLSNRAYRLLAPLAADPAQRYASWVRVLDPSPLYRPEFAERLGGPVDAPSRWLASLYDGPIGGSAAERAIYTDFCSYLPHDLLVKVDIASMACGLECRAPLLDRELVEFALSLPIAWRLGGGARGGKRILRDWARDLLPPTICNRRKMGFGVPIGEWFRGPLRETLRSSLLSSGSLAGRVFRPEALARLLDEHQRGAANHEHALWALLLLERWREKWCPTD